MIGDDDDPLERSETSGIEIALDPSRELAAVLDDLEALLKNVDVEQHLAQRNVNPSLALLGIDGLRNYLEGKKIEAVDDFETLAQEIRGRLELAGPQDQKDA